MLAATGKCYHSSNLKCLGLKWAVCDHIETYLYYARHHDVFTYNNSLPYAMSTVKLNAAG